jgi:glutaminyl-peptide cyclotransferase
MVRNYSKWLIFGLGVLFVGTYILTLIPKCSSDTGSSSVVEAKPLPDLAVPKFNPDSAYVFTEKIVGMGPRVVGTEGAMKVKKYIIGQLKQYGADIIEQNFTASTYDDKKHAATNIIARYNTGATNRVVLSAHWDSRPFADQDLDDADKNKPILGADDSGSSVGMLLEIARQLQANPPANLGVDIVLFDAEDYGDPRKPRSNEEIMAQELTWGLGAQYWSKNLHVSGYKPLYGINLDMAGARGARFVKERISMTYAPNVVEKVWRVAREKYGYTQLFSEEESKDGMTDDHVFVNTIAKIPMIDIINHPVDSYFGKYWHTTDDNMSIIEKDTLRAVGQTVLSVLHYEANGAFK